MPLWIVYYPPGTFVDDESKQALAKDITSFYTSVGLPAFYVVVNFIELPPGKAWFGGQLPEKPSIRIAINHVAIKMPNDSEHYNRATSKIWRLLKPHTADKGYYCEFHVDESERELCRMDGLTPPPHQSEAEARWVKENKPSHYDGHPEPVKD